jgi:hypothetical protein
MERASSVKIVQCGIFQAKMEVNVFSKNAIKMYITRSLVQETCATFVPNAKLDQLQMMSKPNARRLTVTITSLHSRLAKIDQFVLVTRDIVKLTVRPKSL